MELRLDAMFYSNLVNESSDAGIGVASEAQGALAYLIILRGDILNKKVLLA